MIEGLIGMAVAAIIFVLILFFYKRKPNPSLALPLEKYLTAQGFTLIETDSPLLKPVKEVFNLTKYRAYIEQAYHRNHDDSLICWISTDTEGNNNTLISVIPQTIKTDSWILVYLPSLKGGLGSVIRRFYEKMVLSSGFSKLKSSTFGERYEEFELYVKSGAIKPPFDYKFINALKQCDNVIIRSNGTIAVLEKISISRNMSWEQEARELLHITAMMKGSI